MADTIQNNPGTRLQAVIDLGHLLGKLEGLEGSVSQFASATIEQLEELRGSTLGEAQAAALREFDQLGGKLCAEFDDFWDRVKTILEARGWPTEATEFAVEVAADSKRDELEGEIAARHAAADEAEGGGANG